MSEQKPKRRSFDQWKIANPWHRFAAAIIDQTLIGFFTGFLLNFGFPEKIWSLNWWLAWFFLWPFLSMIVQCMSLLFTGTSPGKRQFGIEIVSANPNKPLTPWQIFSRSCAWWLGAFTAGAGWSTILSRSDRRAWHDFVAETVAVTPNLPSGFKTSSWEKTVGHIWIISVSLIMLSLMSIGLYTQVSVLKYDSSKMASEAPPKNQPPKLETLTWLLVLKSDFNVPAETTLTDDEKKLATIFSLYQTARDLPKLEQENYFSTNISKIQNNLCNNNSFSVECRTARVIEALIKGTDLSERELKAYVPVVFMYEMARMMPKDARELAARKSLESPLNSIEYLAYRTFQAQSHLKQGNFLRGAQLLQPDLIHLSNSGGFSQFYRTPASENQNLLKVALQKNMVEIGCLASALNSCEKDILPECQQLSFWADWNHGCQQVSSKVEIQTKAQGFGYWFKQASLDSSIFRREHKNLDFWKAFKQRVEKEKTTYLESNLVSALDFTLNVKIAEPDSLIEKSRFLNADHILVGWGLKLALLEFGDQWAAMSDSDQKSLITQFVSDNDTNRKIAAEPKPHKKKKKKKK